MKKIFHVGIFSGKGGVGKTTICASLSVLLAKHGISLLPVDTDVDAPNLSILFNIKNIKQNETFIQTTEKAELLEDQCIHCKLCINNNYCNFEALSWDCVKEVPIIDLIACEGCHACNLLCGQKAFIIKPVDSGKISQIESLYGFSVISGETILGAQTSGKLVAELKKLAENVAQRQERDMIFYDGPPGIGCPVIAAASGLDFIIVVIEPTTASLHDAQRFLVIAQQFQIQIGIIINKSNLTRNGLTMIREYLEQNHLELLGELPLDKDWPYSVAKRQPFVEYMPLSPTTMTFNEIALKIIEKYQEFLKK